MTWKVRVLWVLAIGYWAALATATHLPPHRVPGGPGGDKFRHVLAYFVLAALLGPALWHAMPSRRRFVPLITLAAAAAYGALDELTQPLVGRYCELNDWFADLGGAAAGCALLYVAHRLSPRRPPPEPRGIAAESA